MLNSSDYLIMRLREHQVRECLRQAEVDRLLGQMNPHQQSWLSRQARKSLHHLGHLLLALGKRLDRPEVPHDAVPLEQAISGAR